MENTEKKANNEVVLNNILKGLLHSGKICKIDTALLNVVKSKVEVKNG